MKKSKWISVTKKMPGNVTPVLVFGYCCDLCHNYKIAEIEHGTYFGVEKDMWFESGTGEGLTFEPSHWMPLPEIPQLPEPINQFIDDCKEYNKVWSDMDKVIGDASNGLIDKFPSKDYTIQEIKSMFADDSKKPTDKD